MSRPFCSTAFRIAVFVSMLVILAQTAATQEIATQEIATQARDNAEPFSIEQIFSAPFPSSLVAARSGSRIAWVFEQQGRKSIWVAEGPEFVARSILEYPYDDGQSLWMVGFSSDAETLVFRRGSTFNPAQNPGGPTKPSIWKIGFSGGEPAEMAQADNLQISPP